MRFSVRSILKNRLLLRMCTAGQAINLAAQQPEFATKKPALPVQIAAQYVAPPARRPVLILEPISEVAQPNQIIHFTLDWRGTIDHEAYVFDWGDGSVTKRTTALWAEHAFLSPGQYTVRVTARPLAGMEVSKANVITSNPATITITTPEKLSVSLRPDKVNPQVNEPVVFEATVRPEPSSARYTYDFGDGTQRVPGSSRIGHVYHSAGAYWVSVTVLTGDGRQSTSSRPFQLKVAAVEEEPPQLKVTLESKGELVVGREVVVTAVLDPPQKGESFLFNWQDGSDPEPEGGPGPAQHRYRNPGDYEVTVLAKTGQTFDRSLEGHVEFTVDPLPPPPPPTTTATTSTTAPTPTTPSTDTPTTTTISTSTTSTSKTPRWLKFLGGAAALLTLALVARAFIPSQFRYVAHPGRSTHEIKMTTIVRSSTPFTLSPGMDREEHILKFRK